MVNVRCSDYAGYTCQNSSTLISSLSICGDVLSKEAFGQHCAPSEPSILHQLEAAVVMPNYNRLMPSARSLISIIDNGYCSAAEKRLAWWVCIFSYALFLLNGLKNFSQISIVIPKACQSLIVNPMFKYFVGTFWLVFLKVLSGNLHAILLFYIFYDPFPRLRKQNLQDLMS